MASNNKKCANQKKSLSRKSWTEEELELYAIILSSEKKILGFKEIIEQRNFSAHKENTRWCAKRQGL